MYQSKGQKIADNLYEKVVKKRINSAGSDSEGAAISDKFKDLSGESQIRWIQFDSVVKYLKQHR